MINGKVIDAMGIPNLLCSGMVVTKEIMKPKNNEEQRVARISKKAKPEILGHFFSS